MNLLLDRKLPVKQGLAATKFIHDLHAANPGAQWTITRERMGCDKAGNIYSDAFFWFYIEKFKLGGVPIFEFERRPECPGGRIKDLRPSQLEMSNDSIKR